MDDKIVCSTTDNIEVLDLSVRVRNALRRSNVFDIGVLIALNDDQLFTVRNLGEKGVAEIRERLGRVSLIDGPPQGPNSDPLNEWTGEPQILIDLGPPMIPLHEVVRSQQAILAKQIRYGLLHPDALVDGDTLGDLVNTRFVHEQSLYARLLMLLTSSVSVSDEIESILNPLDSRELDILILRNGCNKWTLAQIAERLSLTRERVRQIEQKVHQKLSSSLVANPSTRIRSAILQADDKDLSFNAWSVRLRRTGLLGDWSRAEFKHFDQLELLVVLIELLGDASSDIGITDSFNSIMKLRDLNLPNAPARAHVLLEDFRGATKRLVLRHLRYSGAVSLDWLVDQDVVEFSKSDLRLILECLDFFCIDENWYGSYRYMPDRLEKNSVLHNSLLKMFQYCGPLEIQDVYFGIEHTCSRTDFPIPTIGVLEDILSRYGYANDDGLWYWAGNYHSELGQGERVLWETIYGQGGVAHHSQLLQAILDSGRSGPSLGGTISRSPLFDNFQKGLYKLRGSQPDKDVIELARSAAERIPVELTVERDSYGRIKIEANLGILVIANGTLTSDGLPNLIGNWDCDWGDGNFADVRVTQNEIRGLSRIIRFLRCEVGDRLAFTFNVINRTVAIRKTGDSS